jgi:hypothetical protein
MFFFCDPGACGSEMPDDIVQYVGHAKEEPNSDAGWMPKLQLSSVTTSGRTKGRTTAAGS